MTTQELDLDALVRSDIEHIVHPQYHVKDHGEPIIFERGEGARLWDLKGDEYIDGLSGLWNVAVGHGRKELAAVAAKQLETLAFNNSYVGYSNVPSIKLAERLMELVYPNMEALFFCNSGSEAVDGAIKLARFFWNLEGMPDKMKVIARREAYHGGTYGATAATGLPPFHERFGPLPGGFVRVGTCYPYRCSHCKGADDCNLACADEVEQAIVREGPETVAAVIGEPVHGAGGVIVPTPGYWPRLREICDRHDVLLIADEVITGFGRTGRWFALQHWGVQPDMMTIAKAVTSAYVPLAAFIMSSRVHQALLNSPPEIKLWHGYTNAGHPVACAVGLRNLQIIADEGLSEAAAALGKRLLVGLESLSNLANVGNVRGLGLIAGVEVVADKESRMAFEPVRGMGGKLTREMRSRGLLTRVKGESILLAPPLVTSPEQIDRIVDIAGESIQAAVAV